MTPESIANEIRYMLWRTRFVAWLEERRACARFLEKMAERYDVLPDKREAKLLKRVAAALLDREVDYGQT